MPAQLPSPPMDNDGPVRKRVCKACDRCRLKKSKCDGSTPCSRCRSDNAICVFGERKKSQDKIYPKGYVEMLEQQQSQLVNGLQTLYGKMLRGQSWPGPPLQESSNGRPLTHDILEQLGVLDSNSTIGGGNFEEDLGTLQQRLFASGAGFLRGRSPDSDSDHSQSKATFFEPLTQPNDMSNAFAISQTVTPPSSQSPVPTSVSPKLRAPTVQSRGDFQSCMNPGLLQQRQTWAGPPTLFQDPLELSPYDMTAAFGCVKNGQSIRSMPVIDSMNNTAMPDWTEEDFNSFLNTSVS